MFRRKSGSGPDRQPTKKGVLRRAFSFKKSTSESVFDPGSVEAADGEDVANIPILDIGMATDLGFHHEVNEDKATIVRNLLAEFPPEDSSHEYNGTPTRDVTVINVFDGHGGYSCSSWAQEHLHKHLSNLIYRGNFDELIGSALHHSFKTTENEFCHAAKQRNDTAGSCATSVVIKGTKIFCGNAGDSKAMVFQVDPSNKARPINKVDLNERHGAHLKSEKLRIKAAGGKISADGAVYGVLYPTRGFGDIDVKADGKPVVICTPNGAGLDDWEPYKISEGATTYLVVASDGLWDFATDERVMHITLKQPQRTPDEICNALIREARMGGSEDDCTIVVVRISCKAGGRQRAHRKSEHQPNLGSLEEES